MFERSRSLQIYMKPGLKEDDLMLRVWDASHRNSRRQDVFRSMLQAGLVAMVESGEMPESVIEECGLDALVERRRRRGRKATEQQSQVPMHAYVPHYPYAAHPPAPTMAPHHAPQVTYPAQAPLSEPSRETTHPMVATPQIEAKPHIPTEKPAKSPETNDKKGEGGKGRIGNLM